MHALVITSPSWRGNPVRVDIRDARAMRRLTDGSAGLPRRYAPLSMTGRGQGRRIVKQRGYLLALATILVSSLPK